MTSSAAVAASSSSSSAEFGERFIVVKWVERRWENDDDGDDHTRETRKVIKGPKRKAGRQTRHFDREADTVNNTENSLSGDHHVSSCQPWDRSVKTGKVSNLGGSNGQQWMKNAFKESGMQQTSHSCPQQFAPKSSHGSASKQHVMTVAAGTLSTAILGSIRENGLTG
eukprot:CAMPEP_0194753482 /NCGR_PEP_ID=MMETSP0323_2-20130528/7422_1 /TAXON_ID=2866 ORGANISM="Crypthecodinium cohnii, Strain Seligo" /NCGR_SAMPLE_ID=MMETSP0323_2 /ASSEMBLY_ACC=CAM_ASM_000346 /LENGTH=167 /DNA_ID=CAMNT_0039671353 /DNA_START=78 /DNA_END=579 /DNA_ORIENTATION=-